MEKRDFKSDHETMRDRFLALSQEYYREASACTEEVHMYSSYALSAECLVVAFDHAIALVSRLRDAPRHKHIRHIRQLGKFKRLEPGKQKWIVDFLEEIERIRNQLLYLL